MTIEGEKKNAEKQRSERSACENCRQSHSACSRSGPPCYRCSRMSQLPFPCSYEIRTHSPKPRSRSNSNSDSSSSHLLLTPLNSNRKTRAQSSSLPNSLNKNSHRGRKRKSMAEEEDEEDEEDDEDEDGNKRKKGRKQTNRRLSLGSPTLSPRSPGRPRKYPIADEARNNVEVYSGEVGDAFYILGWKVSKIRKKEYPPLPSGSLTSIPIYNPEDGTEIIDEIQGEAESCGLTEGQTHQLWFRHYQKGHSLHDDLPASIVIQVPEDSEEILNAQGIWKRPKSYIVYREKGQEEEYEAVEYDIDSEDEEFLTEINEELEEDEEITEGHLQRI
eukprot:TRINITY_DN609_c0_g1_i2.p1 TRINITY_DN609_c0_g1~~TRINITY_DN609_c0_g1_i2.p1  ORF type:complete len:331 (+),score=136.92 TRINITY_DN609_c0_g1_i2:231-1223(+)